MSKHSPGPWYAVVDTVYTDGCEAYGPTMAIAEVDGLGNENQEANAHLIAAAPDMLKALEDVDARLTHIGHMEANALTHGIVRAAIAKAKGEGE